MKHEHKKEICHHDLKYCENCDVVECNDCGKEWATMCTKDHHSLPILNSATAEVISGGVDRESVFSACGRNNW